VRIQRSYEFQIRTIVESDECHMRETIRMSTAVLGFQADVRELATHTLEVVSANRDVINLQVHPHSE